MPEYSTRENRETPSTPTGHHPVGRLEKGMSPTSSMHVDGESDGRVVPAKGSNKGGQPLAESLEGRRPTKENIEHPTAPRTQSRTSESSGLLGVRNVARQEKHTRFTALLHHVTVERLRDSVYALKRDAAPGVDGVTWREYETDLLGRVVDLHRRVHAGSYRAQPSKRAYIPKADGGQRPLGIAALEDKVIQHAVGAVLATIYEADFLGFSYGFRPGRSQHHALDALWVGLMRKTVNWVLDADIRAFFDTMDHGWLMRFLEHRIADRRILRLIRTWMRAGVSEDGTWSKTEVGTPQGAVISPLLANIFLHYVFDLWVRRWRRRSATGDMIVVRYADDIVVGFEHRADAERFLHEWEARLRSFGLELHPDKTRLIEFGRHAADHRKRRGESKPDTFDFLGFTHLCGTTRKTGRFIVKRQTIRKRLSAKLKALKAELRHRWHTPVRQVGQWLRSVVQGWLNYHAVPGNMDSLNVFRSQVLRYWFRALRRRSQRRPMTWARFLRLVGRWIPSARILHPYPNVRFDAMHPR
ncbi:group II intron reverse transcriptase/maturase [Microbacterium sp.]|uniref:group II intron reverse transcriptase/maturase n=1 Tax=Microbacterium sp. TaxID=51671 RepID=UPI0035248EDB